MLLANRPSLFFFVKPMAAMYVSISIGVASFKATYMFLASSRFRFIYLTASSELIGDFRDSLIFRIFLSDASL